jgi:hypothetical protein
VRGQVALVVTCPPYGRSVHGQVDARPGGVVKYGNRYSDRPDPGDLARANDQALLAAIRQILGACRALLWPGGAVVLIARPPRSVSRRVWSRPTHRLGAVTGWFRP